MVPCGDKMTVARVIRQMTQARDLSLRRMQGRLKRQLHRAIQLRNQPRQLCSDSYGVSGSQR